jgi:hypothetical protein
MLPFRNLGRETGGGAYDAPDRERGTTQRNHRYVAGAPSGCLTRHSLPVAVILGLRPQPWRRRLKRGGERGAVGHSPGVQGSETKSV